VVLLRSGNPLGNSSEDFLSNPMFLPPIIDDSKPIFKLAMATTPGKANE
jgi:hypothetical protein